MAAKRNVPQLRFPGFTDDWEQCKLGELVQFSKGTGYSKSDLKNSGTPIILYGRLYTKYETVISQVDTFADAKKGSVYSHGGEVIVPASGETAEDISIASVVEQPGVILGGDLNIITPPKELDSAFLALCISNGQPHSDMAKVAQGKTVVHLHNDDLKTVNLIYPITAEQKQISQFFGTIDYLITLHQRKLDTMKQYKQGLLQKMFPKEGEKVPEIRFPEFTGDWERRKLGDIIEQCFDKNADMIYGAQDAVGVTLSKEMIPTYANISKSADIGNFYLVYPNCFVYNPRTHGKKIGLGLNTSKRTYIVTFNDTVFRIKDGQGDENYLLLYMSREKWDKEACAVSLGTSTIVLKWDALCNMDFLAPSIEEQKSISELFLDIDTIISLHQRKLNQMKLYKQGLLQQMFI